MFELRHLRMLSAIQRHGSLVSAAPDVHLSQSALSHALKDLEDQLGSRLLVRKSKPLQFTGAGLRLLDLAQRILPEITAAEADLERMSRGGRARLALSMECHSCFDWLLPSLTEFRATFPEVEIDFSLSTPFEPYPALIQGKVDVVFSTDPIDDADIAFLPLFRYQTVLICSPRHRLARKKQVAPADLRDETLITYPVSEKRLDFFSRFLTPAGVAPASVRHAELTMMIVQLVASGQGVAALPRWAVDNEIRQGTLSEARLGSRGLRCDLWAAVRAGEADWEYVAGFVDTARKVSFRSLRGIEEIA